MERQTMKYALKETLASKSRGKDIWYRFWTQIGPCCTDNTKQRALFKSRDEAMRSNAMSHSLSFFETVELPDDAEGDINWNWEKKQ